MSRKAIREAGQLEAQKNLIRPLALVSLFAQRSSLAVKVSSNIIVGFMFGYSISLGLGLTPFYSLIFGVAVSVGVLISSSLVSYLLIQTFFLTLLSAIAYVGFRNTANVVIAPETVQATYLAVVLFAPLATLIPAIRRSLSRVIGTKELEFVAVLLFAALVHFLRVRMPSDPLHALSQMYYLEDNAGVVAVLSRSLEYGYTGHVALFGEFFNGIYLTVAGSIGWFGDYDSLNLVSALSHWNITLLFLAWAPIAALVAITLSGREPERKVSKFVVLGALTIVYILAFWPFNALGHTSAISVGLFASLLLAATLNLKLASAAPMFYVTLISAGGFIVGATWFPLMPFVAALVATVYLTVLRNQYIQGKKRLALSLFISALLMGFLILPQALTLASSNVNYLQMTGGTRAASDLLVIVWLLLIGLVTYVSSKKSNLFFSIDKDLFKISLFLLVLSSVFLYLTGMNTNAGGLGYGATKYLIVTISLSLPILVLVILTIREKLNFQSLISTVMVLVFGLMIAIPESRSVAAQFLAPNVSPDTEAARTFVFLALQEALEKEPDQIFCASDYGHPLPGAEVSMTSYFCTRWGQSLVGDEGGSEWRTVPLGIHPEETLFGVKDVYKTKRVVLIRFPEYSNLLLQQDTWWSKYVDESWEVVIVK